MDTVVFSIVLVFMATLYEVGTEEEHVREVQYYCARFEACAPGGTKVCAYDAYIPWLAEFEDMCTLYKANCDKRGRFIQVEQVVCDTRIKYDKEHSNETFEETTLFTVGSTVDSPDLSEATTLSPYGSNNDNDQSKRTTFSADYSTVEDVANVNDQIEEEPVGSATIDIHDLLKDPKERPNFIIMKETVPTIPDDTNENTTTPSNSTEVTTKSKIKAILYLEGGSTIALGSSSIESGADYGGPHVGGNKDPTRTTKEHTGTYFWERPGKIKAIYIQGAPSTIYIDSNETSSLEMDVTIPESILDGEGDEETSASPSPTQLTTPPTTSKRRSKRFYYIFANHNCYLRKTCTPGGDEVCAVSEDTVTVAKFPDLCHLYGVNCMQLGVYFLMDSNDQAVDCKNANIVYDRVVTLFPGQNTSDYITKGTGTTTTLSYKQIEEMVKDLDVTEVP